MLDCFDPIDFQISISLARLFEFLESNLRHVCRIFMFKATMRGVYSKANIEYRISRTLYSAVIEVELQPATGANLPRVLRGAPMADVD